MFTNFENQNCWVSFFKKKCFAFLKGGFYFRAQFAETFADKHLSKPNGSFSVRFDEALTSRHSQWIRPLIYFYCQTTALEKSPSPAFPLPHPFQYVQSDVKKEKVSKRFFF